MIQMTLYRTLRIQSSRNEIEERSTRKKLANQLTQINILEFLGYFEINHYMDREYIQACIEEACDGEIPRSFDEFMDLVREFVPDDLFEELETLEHIIFTTWMRGIRESEAKTIDDSEDEVDEEEFEDDGGCEMCGREMPLTRHHLRPKRVHGRYKKRGFTSEELNVCAMICRQCHSFVHHCYPHNELADRFYTVDRLMEDETICRFASWASKLPARSKRSLG